MELCFVLEDQHFTISFILVTGDAGAFLNIHVHFLLPDNVAQYSRCFCSYFSVQFVVCFVAFAFSHLPQPLPRLLFILMFVLITRSIGKLKKMGKILYQTFTLISFVLMAAFAVCFRCKLWLVAVLLWQALTVQYLLDFYFHCSHFFVFVCLLFVCYFFRWLNSFSWFLCQSKAFIQALQRDKFSIECIWRESERRTRRRNEKGSIKININNSHWRFHILLCHHHIFFLFWSFKRDNEKQNDELWFSLVVSLFLWRFVSSHFVLLVGTCKMHCNWISFFLLIENWKWLEIFALL